MVSVHSTFMGGKHELVVQERIGVENENVFKLFCKQLTNKFLIKEVKVHGGIVVTFQFNVLSCM